MLTVVWDVDDVLNDLMYQWFVHAWLAGHAECRLRYDDLAANPPHEVLGVDRREYLSSMDLFRRTDRACNMAPNAKALSWFREHGHRFRHIALTARPLETTPAIAHWVMHHFGAWIRCFGVVPTRVDRGIPSYDRSKADFLAWLGRGDILVDDSTDNVRDAQSIGLQTLQLAQPWNQSKLSISDLLSELSKMAG